MEKLDAKQRERVQKASTQRIFNQLMRLGEQEEVLLDMQIPLLEDFIGHATIHLAREKSSGRGF